MLGLISVLLSLELAAITPEDVSKNTSRGELIVRFVSVNDDYIDGPNYPNLLQLDPSGQFTSIDGAIINVTRMNLGGLFSRRQEKADSTLCLVVHVVDPSNTTVSTIVRCIDMLRESIPEGARAVVFFRYRPKTAK